MSHLIAVTGYVKCCLFHVKGFCMLKVIVNAKSVGRVAVDPFL